VGTKLLERGAGLEAFPELPGVRGGQVDVEDAHGVARMWEHVLHGGGRV